MIRPCIAAMISETISHYRNAGQIEVTYVPVVVSLPDDILKADAQDTPRKILEQGRY